MRRGVSQLGFQRVLSYDGLMATDVYLFNAESAERGALGRLIIRDVSFTGQTDLGQPCLTVDVELQPTGGQSPATKLSFLSLNVTVWTSQPPCRKIGRVILGPQGFLPVGDSGSARGDWLWRLLPEDVETVERARSGQPVGPIGFQFEISVVAKVARAGSQPSGDDVIALRATPTQVLIPTSHWDQLLSSLGYELPPTHVALAGQAALDHPSWSETASQLEQARTHHRFGKTTLPLARASPLSRHTSRLLTARQAGKELLRSLPPQKANAVAELLSGLATYCNKVGHHRSKEERDAEGDLTPMPLEHWEADLILGAAQFLLTYASRLRMSGDLAHTPPD